MSATSIDWTVFAREQADRFWAKVARSTGCWLWTGAVDKDGYGKFQVHHHGAPLGQRQKHVRAHRLAFELTNGLVPAGLLVLHECDTPACVRPDHLAVGTQLKNRQDCKARGRVATGDRSGRRLHPEAFPSGERHPNRLHPERLARGEDHPHSRLTEADVVSIRQQHEQGATCALIAVIFGVSKSAIINVCARKTWRHVA